MEAVGKHSVEALLNGQERAIRIVKQTNKKPRDSAGDGPENLAVHLDPVFFS